YHPHNRSARRGGVAPPRSPHRRRGNGRSNRCPRGREDRGRGDRAPTATVVGECDGVFQISIGKTPERATTNTCRDCLATQLLRAHHPERRIPEPHPAIHSE